jgi:hypothetical protein
MELIFLEECIVAAFDPPVWSDQSSSDKMSSNSQPMGKTRSISTQFRVRQSELINIYLR